MFFLNKKNKNFRLIIGRQKKGFCPHLNYWGARARAAPQSLRLWWEQPFLESIKFGHITFVLYTVGPC